MMSTLSLVAPTHRTGLAASVGDELAATRILKIFDGMCHGWQLFAPMLEEGMESIADSARFIEARQGRPCPIQSSKSKADASLHSRGARRPSCASRSVLTTAPGATADTSDARPRDAGIPANPFWYQVLERARAIAFGWCAGTRPGTAILPYRAAVRCRL